VLCVCDLSKGTNNGALSAIPTAISNMMDAPAPITAQPRRMHTGRQKRTARDQQGSGGTPQPLAVHVAGDKEPPRLPCMQSADGA